MFSKEDILYFSSMFVLQNYVVDLGDVGLEWMKFERILRISLGHEELIR